MFSQLKHPQILLQYLFSKKLIDLYKYKVLIADTKFLDLIYKNSTSDVIEEIIDIYLSLKDYSLPFFAANSIILSSYPLLEIGLKIQNSYSNAIQYYLKNHQNTTPLSTIKVDYKNSSLIFSVTPSNIKKGNSLKYIFSTEYHLGEIIHLVSTHLPNLGKPQKITLVYPPPHYSSLYNNLLNCNNIEFNAKQNSIIYQIREADYFCFRSPLSYSVLGEKIYSILNSSQSIIQKETSLKDKIIFILDCYEEEIPNENIISSKLNLHERTLRRKLKKEGETFREIIINYKKEKAIKLLLQNKLNQKQIAKYLGFRDTTSFGRAFKTWTGKTPREFSNRKF
ncbi:helix-turn-helix transcriptional regulator [Acinetobacter sp. AYS6]|uniref:helix-turn-helix domain-containing protein n=1 Tax=Acinetobacter sp. AYS6 TaxID=2983297 RepID=UPI0021D66F39|nr:helix-turn-helix transcriptional regulator [Acinetobacter sp. AYS6]MCU7696964.1 helix-turn-helix transcriptional regulator [Acinetobacter sp. AYS6]